MSAARGGSDPARARARAEAPEVVLARRGAACAVIVAVPVVVVAALVRGVPGLLGAALGAVLVTALFGLAGVLLACVARRAPATLPAVSLVGVLLRMIAYGALLMALDGVDGIDRASTVAATCLLLLATLTYELRYVATTPGFYWLHSPAPDGAQAKERTRG